MKALTGEAAQNNMSLVKEYKMHEVIGPDGIKRTQVDSLKIHDPIKAIDHIFACAT